MSDTINIGSLIGISKENEKHKIGVFIGNDKILMIYEHGLEIFETFYKIKASLIKNIDRKLNNELLIENEQNVKNLNDLKRGLYIIYISENNLFESLNKSNDYFDILQHNFNEMNKFEIGDVIFFDRKIYNHSAIITNIDNFEIIHKNSLHKVEKLIENYFSDKKDSNINAGEIRKNYLIDVIKQSKISKCNFYDIAYPPFTQDEIIKRAYDSLGPEEYDMVNGNCQNYVFLIRNNFAKSPDAEQIKKLFDEVNRDANVIDFLKKLI